MDGLRIGATNFPPSNHGSKTKGKFDKKNTYCEENAHH